MPTLYTTQLLRVSGQIVNYNLERETVILAYAGRVLHKIRVFDETHKKLGFMSYEVKPGYIFIDEMANETLPKNGNRSAPHYIRHVGSLLFEIAFRESIDAEKQGRLSVDAMDQRAGSFFHALGFRPMHWRIHSMSNIELIYEYAQTHNPEIKAKIESIDFLYEFLQENAKTLGEGLTLEETFVYSLYDKDGDPLSGLLVLPIETIPGLKSKFNIQETPPPPAPRINNLIVI
jgi:hypothetical protein